jgi:hypothetical protein
VIIFSTTIRVSFAFATVVVMRLCLNNDVARDPSVARRWLAVRLSFRPFFPCRMVAIHQ